MNTIVMPDCVSNRLLMDVDAAWPAVDWDGWYEYRGKLGSKLASLHYSCVPCAVVGVAGVVASLMLEHYPDIIVDWTFHGAGMHQINPGGRLPAHYDADLHAKKNWRRKLSAVCFLDTIPTEHGGALVIDGYGAVQPVRGTVALFETPNCLHEVTELSTESQTARRTIAVFGYEPVAEASESQSRSAIFV